MSAIEKLVVPDSLLRQVRQLAEKEGVTLEQFISSAMAEKAAAWMTVEYLEHRAARSSEERFRRALSKVPKVEPDEQDRLDQ